MLNDLLKWGGKRPDQPGPVGMGPSAARADEPVIPSKAFPKFLAALSQQPAPVLLDFGPVIGSNVEFFGERLGCKLFIEDFFTDLDRHTRAGTLDDLANGVRDALPARRRQRRRHPVLGLLRLPRQGRRFRRWPADRPDAAPGRRRDGLLLHVERRARRLHEVRDRRREEPPPPASRRAPAATGARSRTATSSGCSRASRLRLVPAEEQHARDPASATIAPLSRAILPACPRSSLC